MKTSLGLGCALSVVLFGTISCAALDEGVLFVSGGCIPDPRPRPAPPPPGTQNAHTREASSLFLDYEKSDGLPYSISFFGVEADLKLGPYRMPDDSSAVVLPADSYELELAYESGKLVLRCWDKDRKHQLIQLETRKEGEFDLGGPLENVRTVRLSSVMPQGKANREEAIGIELDAFGVHTGFTLLGKHLLLKPRWLVSTYPDACKDPNPCRLPDECKVRNTNPCMSRDLCPCPDPDDRIVYVRPKGKKTGDKWEHYHPLSYWYRAGAVFGFDFELGDKDFVYLAPYHSTDRAVKLGEGKYRAEFRYQAAPTRQVRVEVWDVEKEKVVARLSCSFSGTYRTDLPFVGASVIDQGTHAPLAEVRDFPADWGVVGVEFGAFGLVTGLTLIAPMLDVMPAWVRKQSQ